jgi:uncharacterized protein (DUF1778 family)
LVGANTGISTACTAPVLAAVEVLIELTLIVIKDEQSGGVVRLLDHPREVAFFVGALKLALDDVDHDLTPIGAP